MSLRALCFGVSLLALSALHPAASQAADGAAVLARFNGETITKAELDRAVSSLPEQIKQIGIDKIYPQLLEEMIGKKLLIKSAYAAGTEKREDVQAAIKAAADDVVAEAHVNKVVAEKITEDMMKSAYNEAVKAMPKGQEAKASHILVAEEAKAKELIKQIKDGGDFGKLAKENSTDKGSAEQAGSLGWFKEGDMVPEFSKAAFGLKKGTVTETPVKSQFGWHIIKLEDKRDAKAPEFAEVKERIEMQLGNKMARDYIRQLVSEAKVERFAQDGKTPLAAPAAQPAVTQ